jgi:hypothetical protein
MVSSPIFHGLIRRVIGPCLRPLVSSARRRAPLSGVVRKQRHAGARGHERRLRILRQTYFLLLEPIVEAQRRLGGVQALSETADELAQVAVARVEIEEHVGPQVVSGAEPDVGGVTVAV